MSSSPRAVALVALVRPYIDAMSIARSKLCSGTTSVVFFWLLLLLLRVSILLAATYVGINKPALLLLDANGGNGALSKATHTRVPTTAKGTKGRSGF